MDPISAFSLAVNILTVVDLSAKVLSTALEIRSSGDTISNKELAADAQRLKSYCEKFSLQAATTSSQQNATSSISSEDDATLRLLASEAKGIADDIQDNLLKLNKQRSFMQVFRQSIRNTRKQPEMKRKAERLKEIQHKIIFSIMVSLNSSVDNLVLKTDGALARLDENTRSLILTILSENDATRAKMETQISSMHTDLTKNHGQMMDSASQRHDELLSAIRVGPVQDEAPEGENEAEYNKRVTRIILDMLWFSRINDRYENIKPAHQRTFEWIFSAELQLKSSCSFFQWVEQGSGLYWMSGKAGTGKSTLMKFIADDERTNTLLQHWSKGRRYITATYWFWDQSPEPLQKSMEGLYRGLLHDVIMEEASLAPLLFPDQFNSEKQWQSDFPTPNELRRAFSRLVSLEKCPVLVVLLIDGLDEYQATEIEQLGLADSLKGAAYSKHMKIITSSRPETVFENAFKDCDKLYLHDLTYSDRAHFAQDSLYKHRRMEYLASSTEGKKDASELIRSSVKKSEGIFLWLRLVVTSLIQELDACDTIKDLQHVLNQFPPGLEELFLHMMGRIREDRRQRGFLGLLVARRALGARNMQSRRMRFSTTGAIEPYAFALTAICLDGAYTDLDKVVSLEAKPLSDAAGQDLIRKVENRLRNWSAGLLEFGPPCLSTQRTRKTGKWVGISGPRHSDVQVRFMHRSIAEFLDLPFARSHMMDVMSTPALDAGLSLMKGLLVKVKREVAIWGFDAASSTWDFVELILRIARHAENTHTDAVIAILENLDRTLASAFAQFTKGLLMTSSPQHWTDHFPWQMRTDGVPVEPIEAVKTGRRVGFLSVAVESGLAVFTARQLENPQMHLQVNTSKVVPLLSLACRPPPFSIVPGTIRPEIIRKLLEFGASPNQSSLDEDYSFTPWECILQTAIDVRIVNIRGAQQLSDIFTILIKSGADLDVRTHVKRWDKKQGPRGNFIHDSHPLLSVEDVVRYAFLLSTLPSLLSPNEAVPRAFVPFQDVDACWGISDHHWRGYFEGISLIGSKPVDVVRADEKAIQEMGHRLLELIRISTNTTTKVVELVANKNNN